AEALSLLTGVFDDDTMRKLNLRVQEKGEPVERVASDALSSLGITGGREKQEKTLSTKEAGLVRYLWSNKRELVTRTIEHLKLSAIALLLGVLVAVPLGVLLERRRSIAEPVIAIFGITQTIPSIALLAFMIPFLGVGAIP